MDAGKDFWREVFSEPTGEASFSRVATGIIIAFGVGWVTNIVKTSHQLPDLLGLSALIGTLYGLNKVSTAIESRGGQ